MLAALCFLALSSIIPAFHSVEAQAGVRRILVVPVSFQDTAIQTKPGLIGYSVKTYLTEYFDEVSYGRLKLDISVYPNFTLLNGSWSSFESYYYDSNVLKRLLTQVLYNLSGTVDITAYWALMIVHLGPCGYRSCAKGGLTDIPGLISPFRYIVVPFTSSKLYYVYAFLQACGLSDQPKADGWTPMAPTASENDPPHILMAEKAKLGWVSYGSEILSIGRGKHLEAAVYRSSSAAGVRGLILPLTTETSLYVEYRFSEGQDSGIPRNGVLLYVHNHPSGRDEILKVLWVGEEYVDRASRFIVRVLDASPLSALLFVANGLPDLAIKSVTYGGDLIPGREVELTITVENRGDIASMPFKVSVKDEFKTRTISESPLEAGATRTIKTAIMLEPGANEIRISVFSELDSDTSNNDYKIELLATGSLIIKKFWSLKERYDVGSEATIDILVVRDNDGLPAAGAVLEYRGKRYRVNASGYLTLTLSSNEVGRVDVAQDLKLESYYDVRMLDFKVRPYVIFDAVEIYKIECSPARRVNIGSEVTVKLYARYMYDRSNFKGSIKVLNMTREGRGVFTFTLKKADVGREAIRVVSIIDELYGLSKVLQEPFDVIWDVVVVELRSDKEFYNVGEEARVTWNARYAFDNSLFEGKVRLSEGYLKADQPKKVTVEVVGVVDKRYNLTAFKSNAVTLRWDRVSVALSSKLQRVEVGKTVPVDVTAYYELDWTPFDGKVELQPSPLCREVGDITIRVGQITPGKRGITVFNSNIIGVRCDLIEYSLKFDGTVLGYAKTVFKLSYKSDGEPVEGKVFINGKNVPGVGAYVLEEPFYGIFYNVKATADVAGFNQITVESSSVHVGNTLAYAAGATTLAYAVLRLRGKVRSRRPWVEEVPEEVPVEEQIPEMLEREYAAE
jgi:hypothetical protein